MTIMNNAKYNQKIYKKSHNYSLEKSNKQQQQNKKQQ